jgi:N-acyl-D-amino-acid deacylase
VNVVHSPNYTIMIRLLRIVVLTTLLAYALGCAAQTQEPSTSFDALIKGGTVYDGTGTRPRRADIAIRGDRVVAVGKLRNAHAKTVIDARGLAVAPGFINMLSHSEQSLIADGRSMSELKQGVTTEIFGEASMGPLTEEMKKRRMHSRET